MIQKTVSYLIDLIPIERVFVVTDSKYEQQFLYKLYLKVENISDDYGTLEKVNQITVTLSDFGWDDIGRWLSVERYKDKDSFNNVIDGKISVVNSRNNIVVSKTKPVVISGIENII